MPEKDRTIKGALPIKSSDKPIQNKTRAKWDAEKKTVKAIQLAFDVGAEVQYSVRREALDLGITPSDRIRQILGLPVNSRPVRPRLSISLSKEDFQHLAVEYDLNIDDHLGIKQKAAEDLIAKLKGNYTKQKPNPNPKPNHRDRT